MVKSVSNSFAVNNNSNVKSVKQKTIDDGQKGLVIGGVAGAIDGLSRKSWLKDGTPSDTFTKEVSKKLEKSLTPKEKIEFGKIKTFFSDLLNPEIDVHKLRGSIEASEDLKNAVPKNNSETTSQALDRIFSNKDNASLRNELRDIQNNTTIDKKVDIYAAKKLVGANFDTKTKSFKKADGTSKEAFNILEKSVNKIRLKTAALHTVIGGVLLGICGLLLGASAIDSKKKA